MTKPQCPRCAAELNEEFGMITCPGCGSVIFIDFERQAQLAADEAPAHSGAAADAPSPLHEPSSDAVLESYSNYESMSPLDSEIVVEADQDLAPVAESSQNEAHLDEAENTAENAIGDELGLNAYANSEASQAKQGPLAYTLHIEGLDSKELRDSLREALGESRFAWDPQALMTTIAKGKLTLASIEPVKASVLVNRLKRLPLKIWWEQNVVTESSP
jgi:uncharacterized Zn finger protein (UPF0148 family)